MMDESFRQALSDTKLAFDLFRESIGLFRSAKDLLPDSKEKKAASAALDTAEHNAKLAEAKFAQSLGFQLCRKEFPPTPLLVTKEGKVTWYKCTACGTTYYSRRNPSNKVFLEEHEMTQDQQEEKND